MISVVRPIGMTDFIDVEIVYATPERYWRQALQLGPGATVKDALEALDRDLFPADMELAIDRVAIYGHTAKPDKRLHAHDRIELLRPLIRDPKDTRRLRAAANPLRKPKR
jgi:putative ubiquitin-RnfH superfamily antitoxin RatB of RatAB toxin-antitoxin module